MIAIIDYDAGNLKSVEQALWALGNETVITRDYNTIMSADKLILPGVGAFGDAVAKLEEFKLERAIKDFIKTGRPFLGICLGLQLLFDSSPESEGAKGLGLLKGRINKFVSSPELKVPQIGWNSLSIKEGSKLFDGIKNGEQVYFVHSYYLTSDNDIAAATCNYGVDFIASVEVGNVFACQFHPEKSGEVGLKILENFTKL